MKYYIKFEEGNKESLDRACKLAEEHGAVKWGPEWALHFEGNGVLIIEDGEYYTTFLYEQNCIKLGYTELKQYREVYVSEISEEDALKTEEKRIYLGNFNGKHLCVKYSDKKLFKNGKVYGTICYDYIAEIPTKKHEIECTDEQWGEINIILNK